MPSKCESELLCKEYHVTDTRINTGARTARASRRRAGAVPPMVTPPSINAVDTTFANDETAMMDIYVPRPPKVASVEDKTEGLGDQISVDFFVKDAASARSVLQRFRNYFSSDLDLSYEDTVLGQAGLSADDIEAIVDRRQKPARCLEYSKAERTCTVALVDKKEMDAILKDPTGKDISKAPKAGTMKLRLAKAFDDRLDGVSAQYAELVNKKKGLGGWSTADKSLEYPPSGMAAKVMLSKARRAAARPSRPAPRCVGRGHAELPRLPVARAYS